MNYVHVSATIGTRAVDPRTGDDNPVLKQMVRFRSNLQEQFSVMDAKLDHLLDMATNIQLLISKMNKERGLVENVVAADPQITTRFGEKNQLPVPSSAPIATIVSDSVTSSDSVELMNKDTILLEEKFEAKSETQPKCEIESGESPLVLEGVARIVAVFSKDIGNSVFESKSSKDNNVDKFGFDSELSKNSNAHKMFDELTNWYLNPPKEVAAFVDSKKDIYAYMDETNERNEDSAAAWVTGSKMKNIEIHLVFDPGGCHMFDEIVMKVLCVTEMVETDLKIGGQVNGGPIFLKLIICDGMVGLESKFWEIVMKVHKGKFIDRKMNAVFVCHTCKGISLADHFVGPGMLYLHYSFLLQPINIVIILFKANSMAFLLCNVSMNWVKELSNCTSAIGLSASKSLPSWRINGSFGETIISTSIEAKGQGVALEFIISFGSRELNVGVGMMTESLIKQRGDHSTMSRLNKVDKMLDRPSAKPPFQFRHLSLGDKTLSRGEYCHGNGWFCIRRRVLI